MKAALRRAVGWVRGAPRRLSSVLDRHPRLRLVLLLAAPMLILVVVYLGALAVLLLSAPMAWLLVAYLGALAVLLLSAFWTTDVFTSEIIHDFTTSPVKVSVVQNDESNRIARAPR